MNADFMFYLFATLSVACGVGVVFNRNTINAALCFLLSLVGLAGLFELLEAYLLAVLVVFV
ncbi:MAG: NADH-quinone oxidoreductase subunit J, partial [Opitutaceae bacterium]|nr:NADH-quinone oxidoreductase subunit J [Opitutaceae bacterium]